MDSRAHGSFHVEHSRYKKPCLHLPSARLCLSAKSRDQGDVVVAVVVDIGVVVVDDVDDGDDAGDDDGDDAAATDDEDDEMMLVMKTMVAMTVLTMAMMMNF